VYIGITDNPERRLGQHNSGNTASTRGRRPFKLIYTEKHATRIEARSREKFLKSYSGVKEKRDILENIGN